MTQSTSDRIFKGIRTTTVSVIISAFLAVATSTWYAIGVLGKVNQVLVEIKLNTASTYRVSQEVSEIKAQQKSDYKELANRIDVECCGGEKYKFITAPK